MVLYILEYLAISGKGEINENCDGKGQGMETGENVEEWSEKTIKGKE